MVRAARFERGHRQWHSYIPSSILGAPCVVIVFFCVCVVLVRTELSKIVCCVFVFVVEFWVCLCCIV